jgi:hypothetical protein
MTTEPMEQRLTTALSMPMSTAQRAALDLRLTRVLGGASAEGTARRRSPLKRSLLLVAILLIVLPSMFVVGAALMSTEDPFGLVDSAAFQVEIDAAKAAVAIPAGATWPTYLHADGSAAYSAGGGRSWVELSAMCLWEADWLAARAAGDAARLEVARSTILGFPEWQSYRVGIFWTESVRDHIDVLVAAVGRDDPVPLEHEMATNCAGVPGG